MNAAKIVKLFKKYYACIINYMDFFNSFTRCFDRYFAIFASILRINV